MEEKTLFEVWKEFGFETRAKIIDICDWIINKNGSNHIDRTLLHDIKDLPKHQSIAIYYLIGVSITDKYNAARMLEQQILNKELFFYE